MTNTRDKGQGTRDKRHTDKNSNSLIPQPLTLSPVFALSPLFVVDIGRDLKFQGNTSAAGIPEFQDLGSLISQWLPNVYIVAGLVLFFFILLGGIGFIAAGGNQEEIQKSQKVLSSAILGFAILFGSYWIIQIIQVLTGIPILKPGL